MSEQGSHPYCRKMDVLLEYVLDSCIECQYLDYVHDGPVLRARTLGRPEECGRSVRTRIGRAKRWR